MSAATIPLPRFPSYPACDLCDYHELVGPSGHRGVPTTPHNFDPALPAVLFVGQEPGYQENTANRPFVGQSGEFLRDIYFAPPQDNLPPLPSIASIYLSNAARCYKPASLDPAARAYTTCTKAHTLPDLAIILDHHPSLIVVALGGPACTSLHRLLFRKPCTLKSAFNHQLKPIPPTSLSSEKPAYFMATYHPAYLMRDTNFAYAVIGHLALLNHHLTGRTTPRSDPTIVPCRSPHQSKGTP